MNLTVKEIVAAILNLAPAKVVLYEAGGWLEAKRPTDPELDDMPVPSATGSIYAVVAIKENGRVGREFRLEISAAEIAAL